MDVATVLSSSNLYLCNIHNEIPGAERTEKERNEGNGKEWYVWLFKARRNNNNVTKVIGV